MHDKPNDLPMESDDASDGGRLIFFTVALGVSALVWLLAMAGVVLLVAKGCQ